MRAWAGGRGADGPPDLAGSGGQRALLGCRGGAKGQARQTRVRAAGLGLGLLRTPMGMGGSGRRRPGPPYLAEWGLLVSSPLGGLVGGEAWSTALEGGAEGKVLPGTSLGAEGGETLRERRAGRWGEAWRSQLSRGVAERLHQLGEGAGRVRHPKLRGGWSAPARPDWVFFNANSMLFTFHLNLRCCYKLSTSSLFLQSL